MMPNNNTEIRLKPGREKSLKLRNFWVFSGAIAQPPQEADKPAAAVNVVSDRGEFLAVAGYSPKSQISALIPVTSMEKELFSATALASSRAFGLPRESSPTILERGRFQY